MRERTLLFLALLMGCEARHSATPADCDAIRDRLVDRELWALGFRDPALVARQQKALATTLQPETAQCVGRPVSVAMEPCINAAPSVQEVLGCLR